ncbi:MAG TPA: TolC family protein [Cycloclasticus sp.]|nr:TolC family protein [Cycloclasticus sp.]
MKFLHLVAALLSALLVFSNACAIEPVSVSTWLNQLVTQHPALLAAEAAVAKADAERRAADQPLFNPELEFEYESAGVDTKTAGLSQTLDWGDKQSAHLRIADVGWQLSNSKLALQRHQIAADALLALADYHANLNNQNVANKRLNAMADFLGIAQQRSKAGDLTDVDLALAQLAYSEASFAQAKVQAGLIESEQLLLALLGNQSALAFIPTLQGTPKNAEEPIKNKAELVDALPQMQLARLHMEIAHAKVKLRQREQRPNPNIAIRTGKEGKDSLTSIRFSMPLFVRNNFGAEVDAANEQLIQQERHAIHIRRLLLVKLTSSARTFNVNRQAWVEWQATGKQNLLLHEKLLTRLWQAGELSTAEYLIQLKQVLNTEASAIEHRRQLWQSWTQWLMASGNISSWITINKTTAAEARGASS